MLAETAFKAAYTQVASTPYFYVRYHVPFSDVNADLYARSYTKIAAHLGTGMDLMDRPPSAIFRAWAEELQMADVSLAMVSGSKKGESGDIKKGDTYAGKVAAASDQGPYEGTGNAHNFLFDFISKTGYEMAGSPWEVYATDPAIEPDTTKWINQIYSPIAEK